MAEACFELVSQQLHGWPDENQKETFLNAVVTGPKYEFGTFQIYSRV
jgi:hypothetical protein